MPLAGRLRGSSPGARANRFGGIDAIILSGSGRIEHELGVEMSQDRG
jgi:hypothetical protein